MNLFHKKNVLSLLLYCLALLSVKPLYSQMPGDDISLQDTVGPKPKILGLNPSTTPEETKATFENMGMELIDSKTISPFVRAYNYTGTPNALWIKDGTTTAYFFQTSLLRIDTYLKPSFSNFLLIRDQLFDSMGERFSMKQSKESIDEFLQAHLAHLKPGEYDERTEMEISAALLRGNTFYYYRLGDAKEDLTVVLSFSTGKNKEGTIIPQLMLHYSFLKPLEELQAYQEAIKSKILPE